jgi:hypothetical protein
MDETSLERQAGLARLTADATSLMQELPMITAAMLGAA